MATLFFPFTNQATGGQEFPWWTMFTDDEDEQPKPTRQSCSGSARRPCCQRKSTASTGPRRQNSHAANPEEFLTSIASVFLPGLLEAVAAAASAGIPKAEVKPQASTSTSAQGAPKNKSCDEFLSTAAAFASTYFPELYDAVTDAIKKDAAKPSERSNNAFEVKLNVSEFRPQELKVKTVERNIVVEGKHEEKEDGQGFVTRSFVRRFVIPEGVKPETVDCKLTTDGFLILSAPLIIETPVTNERSVPITLSRQPAEAIASAPADAMPEQLETDKAVVVPEQTAADKAAEDPAVKPTMEDSDDEIVIVPISSADQEHLEA